MEKPNLSKKSVTTVILVWQLATTLLIGYGLLTPVDVQRVLSTAEWMAASEVEVNSSISLLEKGYSLVNKVGSTVYAFTYATGYLGNWSQNPNVTMQWALDNGAGVLIKAAAYGNVVLTVNNGNHLIIEKNAAAINASPASGASCEIEDHNLGLTRHYQNGVLADTVTMPSYTIDEQGGVYRAVNTTQQLVSQGTNHSSVFQDAVGNLTSGGSIFWKAGRYPITANHTLPSSKSNITFGGEGASSILYLNANYTNIFNVTGANYLTFENLAFDGNKATCTLSRSGHIDLCAIMLFSGKGTVISNCKFYNWVNHPIVESLGGTSGYNTVTLCEFYNNTWWDIAFAGSAGHSIASNNICNSSYGFEVGGTSTGYQCWTGNIVINPAGKGFIINGPHNTVSNNIIHGGAGYGYGFEIDSPNNTIMNNVVDGCQNYALLVYMTSDNVIFGNVVTGTIGTPRAGITLLTNRLRNQVLENRVIDAAIGIYVYDAGSTGNIIKNNYLDRCTTPINNVAAGANVIKYNDGFVTEKTGSTVSCVNGTWIAHVLAGLPNGACSLKVNGSRLINETCTVIDPAIIAENSTHVQIEFLCNNAGTFNPIGTAEAKTIL